MIESNEENEPETKKETENKEKEQEIETKEQVQTNEEVKTTKESLNQPDNQDNLEELNKLKERVKYLENALQESERIKDEMTNKCSALQEELDNLKNKFDFYIFFKCLNLTMNFFFAQKSKKNWK